MVRGGNGLSKPAAATRLPARVPVARAVPLRQSLQTLPPDCASHRGLRATPWQRL